MPLLEFDARLRYPTGFQINARFETDAAVTGLFGPSGSGKTSVLSMIAGLRRPDSGLVRLCQNVLYHHQTGVDLPPETRHIAYVFQDHLLFPHLSVRNNLLYGWRRRKRTGRAASSPDGEAHPLNYDRVVSVLELGDLADRGPHTLSGGQRQRVALGRALLSRPSLLLLDETLAAVDEALKEKVLDYIRQALTEWPIPTLYVTHDAAELKRMAGWVVKLEQGGVSGVGPPADVL